MNIINVNYKWANPLQKRQGTKYLILHHAAASKASPEDIHQWHLEKGWSGIGYHWVIRKDGNIYQGRPIDVLGAHCEGWNSFSLGICFEGNYEMEQPTPEQIQSGIDLIRYVRRTYKNITILRHKDANPGTTTCPGANFRNIIIYEGSKDMEQKHWAEDIFKELTEKYGLTIHDKRFDDNITRGEVFALLKQILDKTIK